MNLLQGGKPDRIVLRAAESKLSAGQVQDRCASLGQFLKEMQVTRVALLADNSMDWICVDLACQQARICLVPIPTFFSKQQIRHVLDSCAISAIITDQAALLSEVAGSTIEFSPCVGTDSLLLGLRRVATDSALLPPGTDKITFTSGSTGQPKGVCLSADHLLLQAQRICDAVAVSQPRHLCLLPLSTLLENVAGVYAPLLAQGEIFVPGPHYLGFAGSTLANPQQLLARITELQPNTLILLPQLLSLLVAAAANGWRVPASLQFVAVGGARVSSHTILAARAAGIPVYEGYGLSECASVVSLNTAANDKPGSCGKPLPGIGVTINAGELIVTGSAMLGYLNEPASWHPTGIATGDIGKLDDDGFLGISGRSKNVLISSYGRNISPEWVESELLANPLVSEAVVIGDARPYCVALLFVRSDQIADSAIQAWIDQVNCGLPDYAQIRRWLRLSAPLASNLQCMTENGRPRRDMISSTFHAQIEQLYADAEIFVAMTATA